MEFLFSVIISLVVILPANGIHALAHKIHHQNKQVQVRTNLPTP